METIGSSIVALYRFGAIVLFTFEGSGIKLQFRQ